MSESYVRLHVTGEGEWGGIALVAIPDHDLPMLIGIKGDFLCRWELSTGSLRWKNDIIPEMCLGFWLTQSAEGAVVLIVVTDTHIQLWDAASGNVLKSHSDENLNRIRSVSFGTLSDGRLAVVGGGIDELIYRWDVASGELIGSPLKGHTGPINCVKFVELPDGRAVVASAAEDYTVRRWDFETGNPIGNPFLVPGGEIWEYEYLESMLSSAGQLILVAQDWAGTECGYWDMNTGEQIGRIFHVKDRFFDQLDDSSPSLILMDLLEVDGALRIMFSVDGQLSHEWDLATGSYMGAKNTRLANIMATVKIPGGETLAAIYDAEGDILIIPMASVLDSEEQTDTRLVTTDEQIYIKD